MTDLFDEWGVDDQEPDEFDDLDDGEHDEDLEDMEPDGDDLDDLDEDDLSDLLGPDEDDDDEEDEEEDDDLDLDELSSDLPGSVEVSCPYCAASVELIIDPVGGELQEYVEDCEVCCQPWSVRLVLGPEGSASVELGTLDDG